MATHEKLTTQPADRWRQAARLFASGAIRAALRLEAPWPSPALEFQATPEETPAEGRPKVRKAA